MTTVNKTLPTPRPVQTLTISDRLIEPLRIVAGRARMLAWFQALFKLLALVAGVWLVSALVLGARLQIAGWVGISLAVVAWGVILFGAFRILRPLFSRPTGMTAAAQLVDRAMPDTEERISSAVELSQEKEPAFRGSPELVAVLMRQAEHHADTMDPGAVISGRDVMRWLGAAGVMLLVWFVLLVVLTPNMLLGMQRLFAPWTATAAAPPPVVEVNPGDAILAQGSKFDVDAEVKPAEEVSLDNGIQQVEKATFLQHFTSKNGGAVAPDLSLPMQRTGPRTFRLHFENVQQSFTYRIIAEGDKEIGHGESADYTVSVQTRPAIADLEVMYTFPAYTRLQPRTDHSHDGGIDALVGTKIRLTVHATEPVKTATVRMEDDGFGAAKTVELAPVEADQKGNGAGEAAYAGEFTVNKSTQYHVGLVKEDGRENADTQGRPITVRLDKPPVISIVSPDARAGNLKVRPDDLVPLRYLATDDFGVNSIEAIVQVDDHPPVSFPVAPGAGPGAIGAKGDARITGEWTLDLTDVLRVGTRLGPATGAEPKKVAYQFKATDTREPEPQESLSVKQYLDLDKTVAPLPQRMDTAAARDLASAVKNATENLKDAQAKLDDLKKTDVDKALTDPDKKHLSDAQTKISAARQQLAQAAEQANSTHLNDMARQVSDIADKSVRPAEEEAAKAGLASDQQASRQESEANARTKVGEALEKLAKISDALNDTVKGQPLAQALERLAGEQRKLAEELARNPNDPKLLAQQKRLQEELDQLIKDNPQLQQPAANANQAHVNDLVKKVQQLEQAQGPLENQLNNVKNAAGAAEKAKDLARQQDQLNKDVAQFAQQQDPAMRQAGASAPDPAKLEPIVQELQDNKLSAANRDQRTAAGQLDQAAGKLESQQKAQEATAAPRQRAQEQAAKDAQTASDAQQQASKLAQEIQEARDQHNPPTRPGDKANQDAVKLADQIKRDAQQMAQSAGQNTAAKNAAQAAAKAADAAKAAAQQARSDEAQRQLSDAANQLTQAAQAEQNAAGAMPAGSPQANSPSQAAQQARSLADRQQALADQAAALAKSQEDAAGTRADAAGTAQRQQQLAERMNEAAKDAQDLQQQTQGPAPELSQHAGQAAQALQQAAQAQRDAAESTRGSNLPDSAARQTQAGDRLADAEQALTGQRPPRGNTGPRPASPSALAGNQQPRTPNQETPPATNPPAGGNQPSPSGQNGSPQTAQGADPSQGQTQGQSGQPNPQSGNPNPSQSTASNGNNPKDGAGRGSGPSSPMPTSPIGMGGTSGTGKDGSPASGSPANRGGSTASAGGQGQDASAGPAGNASGNAPGGQAAGQSVQDARSSQSQAMGGNPQAARQAADQLSQAARQMAPNGSPSGQPGQNGSAGQGASGQNGMAQGSPGQGGAGQGGPGQGQGSIGGGTGQPGGNASANGQGGAASSGNSTPGNPAGQGGGGGGIQVTMNGSTLKEEPKEVKDVGISPSDWARLPPDMQTQLLHSAQQAGPPEYRDSIKNYFSRIARMQAQSEGPR